MFKFFKYLTLFLFLALILVGAAGVGALYYLVVVEPGPEVEEAYIERILGQESPVYYRDGQTKLGVLFQDVHRQYVPYDEIPKSFIDAIVASEDSEFFTHYGVDVTGIARAMVANYKAGRIVQGGSTITQQTAKNLFKREARSYKAKLKELLFALRLEYKYSKEKILEFYANQFFVSGNGHGLGVAAKYYFNKEPSELELLECAYIAGSVKRPNYYNPFTKKNRENPEAAQKKVDDRLRYVLTRMQIENRITPDQLEKALNAELIFDRGKMSFRLNTSMDLVKEGLGSTTITNALEQNGIFNVSTSGIRIVTTIDREIQQKTLYSLRRHLSLLDVRINGFNREEIQYNYKQLDYKGDKEFITGAFMFGTITENNTNPDTGASLVVSFANSDHTAVVDETGIKRIISAFAKYRDNKWAEPKKIDRKKLLSQLQVGDLVYISLREQNEEGVFPADLEKFPQIEGGVLALQQGVIRTMAGGSTDRFFNRAIDAQRLMGSTLKPFVFAAAIQLGWSPVDLLQNTRDVFVFMDRPYFPRPDHKSPHEQVSMSWAGVTSENLAAIWLLYHITDHLNPPRVRELASHLDMAPRSDGEFTEPYQVFKSRIRDQYGILVNRGAIKKAAFDKAKKVLRTDFLFDNRLEEYAGLEKLHYGLNYDKYLSELEASLEDKKITNRQKTEIKKRIPLLKDSYLELKEKYNLFVSFQEYIQRESGKVDNFLGNFFHEPVINYSYGFLAQDNEQKVHFHTSSEDLVEDTRLWPIEQVISYVASLNSQQKEQFWNLVLLEGKITSTSYRELTYQMDIEERELLAFKPYSMELLTEVRDYRVMLGLQYLIHLGRECGIESKLEPVLSFPLGSNVMTLIEAVRLYEALITGKIYTFDQQAELDGDFEEENGRSSDGLSLIERIEAPDGETIYQQKVVEKRVFDPKTTAAISSILENTVRYGTGRFAYNNVSVHSTIPEREEELSGSNVHVPLLGKTGTANNYRNASFLGFVPTVHENDTGFFSFHGGYALGVYTGFDTNEPMRKGNTRISGSSGALPVWSDVAGTLLAYDGVGDKLDLVDLAFSGLLLKYPTVGQYYIPVAPDRAGKIKQGRTPKQQNFSPAWPSSLGFGQGSNQAYFEPERYFQPYWNNIKKIKESTQESEDQ